MNLLCFGDSNTWGFSPTGGRYAAELRWPNRLASLLHVELRAEGQPGRTLRAQRPELGLLSGFHAWQQTLRTSPHQIILALGINDLAAGASPADCVASLENYLQSWQELSPDSKLLLLAPAPLGYLTGGWLKLFANQQEASRELAPLWSACAARWSLDCHLCGPNFVPGADGLHWTADYHAELASALATRLRG